jgi:hypothetical protein
LAGFCEFRLSPNLPGYLIVTSKELQKFRPYAVIGPVQDREQAGTEHLRCSLVRNFAATNASYLGFCPKAFMHIEMSDGKLVQIR